MAIHEVETRFKIGRFGIGGKPGRVVDSSHPSILVNAREYLRGCWAMECVRVEGPDTVRVAQIDNDYEVGHREVKGSEINTDSSIRKARLCWWESK